MPPDTLTHASNTGGGEGLTLSPARSTSAFDIAFYEARRKVKDSVEADADGIDAPLSLWVKGEDGSLTRAKGDHLTLRKRSVIIAGKRTSITIQDGLWLEFKAIAKQRGARIHELLIEIDAKRRSEKLSGAVRHFIYRQLALSLSPPIAADDFVDATLVYGDEHNA